MKRYIAVLVVAGFAFPLGCGGGTPPPKTEETAASSGSSGGEAKASTEESKASEPAPAASAATAKEGSDTPAAGSAAPAGTGGAGGGAGDTSGDIKINKDDPWMAGHQMPSSDVLKTIKPHQAAIQACFNAGKKRDKSVNGEVKIKFVATHDGKVRVWKDDDSSMSDPKVTKCMGEVIKKLVFPKQKSPGDAYGTYDINFGS
jgi:hypothetical protein